MKIHGTPQDLSSSSLFARKRYLPGFAAQNIGCTASCRSVLLFNISSNHCSPTQQSVSDTFRQHNWVLSWMGTTRAEDAQGTPAQSHISPRILSYEEHTKGSVCSNRHETVMLSCNWAWVSGKEPYTLNPHTLSRSFGSGVWGLGLGV